MPLAKICYLAYILQFNVMLPMVGFFRVALEWSDFNYVSLTIRVLSITYFN